MKQAHVVGRFLAVLADSNADADTDPDQVPLTGTVTLTPQVPAILDTSTTPPATILPSPVVTTLDADGDISLNGVKGVTVLASTDPDTNPTNWTYNVSFNLTNGKSKINYNSYAVELPPNVTTDLTLVARVPQSNGIGVTRGVGVASVTAGDGTIVFHLTDQRAEEVPLEGVVVASVNGQSGAAIVGDLRADELVVVDSPTRAALDAVYAEKAVADALVTEVSTLSTTVDERISTEVATLNTAIDEADSATLTSAQGYVDERVTAEVTRADSAYAPANVLADAVTAVNGQKGNVTVPLVDDSTITAIAKNSSSALRTEIKAITSTEVATPLAAKLDKTEAASTYATSASVTTELELRVNPLVDQRVASDAGVTGAAEAAVNTAITSADLVKGNDKRIPQGAASPDTAFALVDTTGRISDVEIGMDGHFTARAAGNIATVISNLPVPPFIPNSKDSGMGTKPLGTFAVLDKDGRVSDLELGADGHFTDRVVTSLAPRVASAIPPTPEKPIYVAEVSGGKLYRNNLVTQKRELLVSTGNPTNATTLPDGSIIFTSDAGVQGVRVDGTVGPLTTTKHIAFWGDSMTWSDGSYYPNRVAERTGLTVFNGGIGGQSSTDIAIRAGGIIPLVTITGGSILASTDYTPATITPVGDYRLNDATWWFDGTLAGIPGTLRFNSVDGWSFKRTTAGTATAVTANTPFIVSNPTYKDSITVAWLGRNNVWSNQKTNGTRMGAVIRDMEAIVNSRTPLNRRYVVMAPINATTEYGTSTVYTDTVAINEAVVDRFGSNALDVRRAFIDRGLALAGIAPTATDTTAIARDTPPPSLMNTAGDHPNPTGYQVIGEIVAEHIISKGWTL